MTRVTVAYAVVHDTSPQVFLAEDLDVLHRVIATKVVAAVEPISITQSESEALREALLDERWGDAVSLWITATETSVDVYPNIEVWTEQMLPSHVTSFELRTTPLFRDQDS